MNIHLPAILMFTRGTRFWHTAIWKLTYQPSWDHPWFIGYGPDQWMEWGSLFSDLQRPKSENEAIKVGMWTKGDMNWQGFIQPRNCVVVWSADWKGEQMLNGQTRHQLDDDNDDDDDACVCSAFCSLGFLAHWEHVTWCDLRPLFQDP